MSASVETHGHESGHASAKFYWFIGAVLTIITAVEVAIFYIPALAGILVPSLLILSAGKFALVVMYYMHLKPDHKIYTGVFMAGFVLAAFLVSALIVLYKVIPPYGVVPPA